jgi:uncharacterized protein
MPVVIADASPLVALSLSGRLELLHQLYGEVQLVQAVAQEVLAGQFNESENNIRAAMERGWLNIVDASVSSASFEPEQLTSWKHLDAGEAQSIAYALSLARKPLLLMDERAAKQLCDELGLPTLGTTAIMLSAKNKGLIKLVKPELERLHQQGFWLSPQIMKKILILAQEWL